MCRFLTKEIVSGPDENDDDEFDLAVEVGTQTASMYDFQIAYSDAGGPPVLIEDTVPAEWNVEEIGDDTLNCEIGSANGKNNGKSATKIACLPDSDSGMVSFWAETRCHGNRNNSKCRPTSCGALYLNEGAVAYELDPATGEPMLDQDGERLPPILESNSLCLAAVSDLDGSGIDPTGGGDEDGDGVSDHTEACSIGSDPCLEDSDSDGVNDGEDVCPLDGDEGLGVDSVGCPLGQFPVRGTWNFDLDLGEESSEGADVWFERVTANESIFVPKNGAMIAIFGPAMPSPTDCAAAPLAATPVNFFDLGPTIPSDWLCAMTDEGNLSAFRIYSGDAPEPVWDSQNIVIEYVTWP